MVRISFSNKHSIAIPRIQLLNIGNMSGLRSRVVLITGAVSSIGRATALSFAQSGSKLALITMKDTTKENEGFHNSNKLEKISQECKSLGATDIHTGQYDLGKREGCRAALEETADRFRGMYYLFTLNHI